MDYTEKYEEQMDRLLDELRFHDPESEEYERVCARISDLERLVGTIKAKNDEIDKLKLQVVERDVANSGNANMLKLKNAELESMRNDRRKPSGDTIVKTAGYLVGLMAVIFVELRGGMLRGDDVKFLPKL